MAIADKIAADAKERARPESLLLFVVGSSEQTVAEEGVHGVYQRHFTDAQAVVHATFVQARERCEPMERQHVHMVPARQDILSSCKCLLECLVAQQNRAICKQYGEFFGRYVISS